MVTYLSDTDSLEVYTGAAFVIVNDNTAAILKSIIDAKADLIVGTAADTPARLAVGTDGQVLTADSNETAGIKWATPAVTFNAQTGTTYTLALSDASKLVTLSNASPITLTVPAEATTAFPTGSRLDLAQLGAGQVTVSPAAGVTINSKDTNKKLNDQFSAASLIYEGSDVWLLIGDLVA
jgi:hypothetical protein